MSERAPYSRVYWTILSDEKFEGIREHVDLLGAWLLLLVTADAMYPSPALVPATLRRRQLGALVDCGLVDLLSGGRYRVHGLDAERQRRQDAARASASARWAPSHTERIPDARRTDTERNARTSRGLEEDEKGPPQPPLDDPAMTYMELAGHFPSEKARRWLDDLASEYGSEDVSRALAAIWPDATPATAISRCQDRLKAEARAATRRKPRYGLTPEQQAMAAFMAGTEKP